MAKKVTQANDTQDKDANVPEVIRDHLVTGNVYTKAVEAAKEALGLFSKGAKEIDRLQTEIQLARQGNAAKLFNLAKECVKLTMVKGKADLRKAGMLMRDACAAAEADTVNAWNNANPGQHVDAIRKIVPSWPPMRTYMVQAMVKAGLNPNDFETPTKVKEAYAKWIEANPEQTDGRGARPRPTDTSAPTSRDAKTITGHVENIATAPRHAIALLVKAVEALPSKELQAEAAELISNCIQEIGKLKAKGAGETTERKAPVPPRPAREPAPTGASAD